MKKMISSLMKVSIRLVLLIFSRRFFVWIENKFNKIYSYSKSIEFADCGNDFKINFPIYLHGGEYVKIGNRFRSDQRLRLEAISKMSAEVFTPEILFGNNVYIQKDCHIAAINKIHIGNNVLIASKVYIGDHSHGKLNKDDIEIPPGQRKLYSKGAVIIEDNVWIGENAIILPGVRIGKNCVIGAGSVVTKNCLANCIYAGNPAKMIKEI